MTERIYWIIENGMDEIGFPTGEILFRGTYEEAQSYAKEIGNMNAEISKAIINNNRFVIDEQ